MEYVPKMSWGRHKRAYSNCEVKVKAGDAIASHRPSFTQLQCWAERVLLNPRTALRVTSRPFSRTEKPKSCVCPLRSSTQGHWTRNNLQGCLFCVDYYFFRWVMRKCKLDGIETWYRRNRIVREVGAGAGVPCQWPVARPRPSFFLTGYSAKASATIL